MFFQTEAVLVVLADMTGLGWELLKVEKALALLKRVELLVNMIVIEGKRSIRINCISRCVVFFPCKKKVRPKICQDLVNSVKIA